MYKLILFFILFYFQFVNTYDTYYSLSKEEVLKLKDRYYISFYCKNDTCVETHYGYNDSYVEFKDENGNLIKYIADTCRYEQVKLNECFAHAKCNTDSECLSNKCFNNYCIFNDETPIVHCDDIYSLMFFRSSYMHCGKRYGDICTTNDECSSMKCRNGSCNSQEDGPSDNESIDSVMQGFILIGIIIIITIICCICCCCCHKKKIKIKIKTRK